MESKEYIEKRLEDQREWYSKKSIINKNYYHWLKLLTIVFSISITVILGLENYLSLSNISAPIAAVLGALVAILTSISGLMKFEEKWINYRTCSERLKKERYLFEAEIAPYDKNEALKLLVSTVENIISRENTEWSTYIKKEKGGSLDFPSSS